MTYAIADHPKLSAAAVALRDANGGSAVAPSVAFVADADAAELILGLAGTAFAGADAETAKLAIVLQLNLQQETGGGRLAKSETRGTRRIEYADDGLVHGLARQLADRLLATLEADASSDDAWAVVHQTR